MTRTLMQTLNDLTRLELLKLSNDQRPPNYLCYMSDDPEENFPISEFDWSDMNMTAPEGWSYYDDELIEQLAKLWKKYGAVDTVAEA